MSMLKQQINCCTAAPDADQVKSTSTSQPLRAMYDSYKIFDLPLLWLFTVSEHITIVIPWASFGVLGALSGPAITTNPAPNALDILKRAPAVLFWMWLVILVFTVSNQRLPTSVIEDRSNKPWRPLPSERISVDEARRLLLFLLPAVYILTSLMGAPDKALFAMLLTWMYNDLKGSDESFIIRNLLNSLGLTCWSIGVTEVACGGSGFTISSIGYRWLFLLGGLIFTTLQLQDFRDQAGDEIKGRRTFPIVVGDGLARNITAGTIMLWSFICPAAWSLDVRFWVVPVAIGMTIAWRLTRYIGDSRADELTWKMWGGWMLSLFALPLCKHPEALGFSSTMSL